jgi:hypothetical protein
MRRGLLEPFAAKLSPDDSVLIEAAGNAMSAAAVIAPQVEKVVIANPKQVRPARMPTRAGTNVLTRNQSRHSTPHQPPVREPS